MLSLETKENAVLLEIRREHCGGVRTLTLEHPSRIVIDLPNVRRLQLPEPAEPVVRLRFAVHAPDRGRLVLETRTPMRLSVLNEQSVDDGCVWQANLSVKHSNAPKPMPAATVQHVTVKPVVVKPAVVKSVVKAVSPQAGAGRVIVLDPGHGGSDPGAVEGDLQEKDITLMLARRVRAHLKAVLPAARVVLTRDDDRFVPLRERSRIAVAQQADWFISLHADKLESDPSVRGASVYTLSNAATDDAAAELARSENGSEDVIGNDAEVAAILLSLAQSKANSAAETLADTLVHALRETGAVTGHAHRRAGFRVLKTAEVPSVLIEAGYLSNDADRALLTNPSFRERFAQAVAGAVAAVAKANKSFP